MKSESTYVFAWYLFNNNENNLTNLLLVSEVVKAVGEKCHSVKLLYPFNKYGLFLPPSESTGGVWLHNEDPINYYHIESKVCHQTNI